MGLFADKLEYLEGTKTAIKDAIVSLGTPILETDTFRSYADKIKTINTFDGSYTDRQLPIYDMTAFKKILEDDVQEGQGNKKILVVTKQHYFGANSGSTDIYAKVTGLKVIGDKYYARADLDSFNNGDVYFTKRLGSRYGLFGTFSVFIIYYDDTATVLTGFNNVDTSSMIYVCSKGVDLTDSALNNPNILYDVINCKVTTTSNYFNFNSSFPYFFADSNNLQEGKPVNFQNSNYIMNINNIDFTKNPLYNINSFQRASKLSYIPDITLPAGTTDLTGFFWDCASLKNIGSLDTQNIVKMDRMFSGCYTLDNIPPLNMTKTESTVYMFEKCMSLRNPNNIDLSNVKSTQSMFDLCQNLESINVVSTEKSTVFYGMFNGCRSLKTVSGLNFASSARGSASGMFDGCLNLETINAINIKAELNLSSLPKITKQTLLSLMNNVIAPDDGWMRTLKLHPTSFALLTDEELLIAFDKNWAFTDGALVLESVGATTGSYTVGGTLTVGDALPADVTVRYQWYAYCYEYDDDGYMTDDYHAIEGATGKTYTPTLNDCGKVIYPLIYGSGRYTGSYIEDDDYYPERIVTNPNDTVAPTVSVATQTVASFADVVVNIQSSDASGFVYLVEDGNLIPDKFKLDELVSWDSAGRGVVIAANTDVAIPIIDLDLGVYYAYAVDESGNISAKSTNAVTIITGSSNITSPSFACLPSNTTMTITLTGGKFATGDLKYNDFSFDYYVGDGIEQATYTRVSDTVVQITNISGVGTGNADVTIKKWALAAQPSAVTVTMS